MQSRQWVIRQLAKDIPANPGINVLVPRSSNFGILLIDGEFYVVQWPLVLEFVGHDQPREASADAHDAQAAGREGEGRGVDRPVGFGAVCFVGWHFE